METISFEDVMKIDMRVGKIVKAEEVEGSTKLLRLEVNFGEDVGERVIFSGIKKWYSPEDVEGKKTAFILNMPEKKMGDFGVSQGMILAIDDEGDGERRAILIELGDNVSLGAKLV